MNFTLGRRIKNFIKLRMPVNKSQSLKSLPVDNHGLQKIYYKNGVIKAEIQYKNGKIEGIATLYYENGNVKAREFYRNNQLQGLSKWYYESGELKSEKYFKEGLLQYSKEFDKKGREITIKQ